MSDTPVNTTPAATTAAGAAATQSTPPANATSPAPAQPGTSTAVKVEGATPEAATSLTDFNKQTPQDGKIKESADPAKAPPPTAPEKYEFKLPEGTTLSAEAQDGLTKTFKELNLTQEAADKLTAQAAPLIQQAHKAGEDKKWAEIMAYREEMGKKNEEAIRNHKEFGGAKFEESKAIAQRTLRKYASPELLQRLDETRLGSDPAVFEFCLKIGRELSEDGVVKASPDNAPAQSFEERWMGRAVQQIEQLKQGKI